MKLGMLTACLPAWSLDRIAYFAAGQGYERLEVALWPPIGGREFEASHLPVTTFTDEDAEAVRATLDGTGLEISALAYHERSRTRTRCGRARMPTLSRACASHIRRCGHSSRTRRRNSDYR